ncbi:MAG: GatB/YqeY domain-containing protein [Pseudomonadota bacterium]
MDAPLKQRIQEDMKTTLRAQDKPRLSVIRMILAAVKQIEVDERIELDDARIFQVLNKMLKQRRDSIAQYSQAKRDDLVEQERFEETIIQTYLPKALTEREVDQLLSQTIEQVGATSVRDMGKVMTELKLKLEGRADIGVISAKVKERLSSF